jgi:NodT family efflux transporter outer membrane factor (OMF) lipoprotein
MRIRALVGYAALGATLGGCAVGPDYKRPTAPVSPSWKEEEAASATMREQWKPAEPKDDAHRGKWWEIFGDAQLNALEDQVSISNLNIAQSEAQFRGARAAVRGARADFFPTVTGTAAVTRSESRPSAVSGTTPTTTTSYDLPIDLSYEADVFGRIRRNVEANVANAQASAADLETVRLAIQADLALDYFQLRGIDAQKGLLDSNVVAYDRALQLTINRHNQGVVSGVDVAQAETQLYNTRATSTDLSLGRAQFEHAIAILVGKPPRELSIAPVTVEYAPPPIPLELPSELLERRPEIAAAERRVAVANAQVGVATAAFFPRLLLAASGGYGSSTLTSFFSLPNRFWSIGPSLVATLFDGGRRRSVRDQARASYDASVAVYRQSVLTAFGEVEDNLAALRILTDEAGQQADATAAAERALTLARNRYEGGITTYLEVVTAEAIALADERVAIDLLTRRMTASVNLIKALGGGWKSSDLPGPAAARARTAEDAAGTRPSE